ncbi:phosphopantetheine-binding protein [Paenibacillus sp. MAH-36]|uniref:Phosphopantetheine-binding protein n=1 Tax=Paenibacillus violae TaxID=3077234 RepID=A0ABU3RLH4_9BACL|nr:phosphopantetheine-binding protein [Paenibacillus sp. PFR10]MDU0205142.1 phosphopantetheine-binding protein [Paenibacillus sp. PFR10]
MTLQYKDVENYLYNTLQEKLKLFGVSREEFIDSFQLLPGLIDSLGFLELVAQVEQDLKVEMDFELADPEQYTTLAGFIHCIKGL